MTTNKLLSSVKLIGAILLMVICALPANAQFLRTSYFMEGSHYRMQLNPALTPTKGYFNIPVVGAVNATVSSTSLSYQDVIDIIDNGDSFYKSSDFMGRLKDKNNLNVNFNTEILSAGWYKGQNFWSFNVGLRADIGANITKSMFSFLNEMDEFEDSWRNSNYDISGQRLDVNSYVEVGMGYARQINSRLSVGGKLKFLLGAGNMNLKMNEVTMKANLPSDEDISYFEHLQMDDVNSPAKINDLRNKINAYHAKLTVDARLESSCKGLNLPEENGYIDDFDFDAGKMGIAGYGFGIDLGASYKVLDNLTVSASVLDLGFISWSKGSTKVATTTGANFEMEGSTYITGIDPNNPAGTIMAIQKNIELLQTDAKSYMDRVSGGDVLDYEMLQLKTDEQAAKSRKSRLAATMVFGAEYGLLNNKLGFGVLSTTRFLQPKTLTEITFSANYRPKNWINATLSYSAIQSLGKSFGLGLKLGMLFLGTDYMFLGKNSNSVNGFVGISIPLGGKKANNEG